MPTGRELVHQGPPEGTSSIPPRSGHYPDSGAPSRENLSIRGGRHHLHRPHVPPLDSNLPPASLVDSRAHILQPRTPRDPVSPLPRRTISSRWSRRGFEWTKFSKVHRGGAVREGGREGGSRSLRPSPGRRVLSLGGEVDGNECPVDPSTT